VKIWDTIGDEHILKSEFKVLGGRVYVNSCPVHSFKRAAHINHPEMILAGMEKANELLPSVTAVKSAFRFQASFIFALVNSSPPSGLPIVSNSIPEQLLVTSLDIPRSSTPFQSAMNAHSAP
jgi:hypothetical protein